LLLAWSHGDLPQACLPSGRAGAGRAGRPLAPLGHTTCRRSNNVFNYIRKFKKYRMKYLLLISILCTYSIQNTAFSQPNNCSIINRAFRPGESVSYVVSYNVFIFWTEVGEVNFKVNEAEILGKPCYHLLGTGMSYPSWDWFFKVRDIYQSWVHPITLKPYAYKRDVYEGGYEIDIKYIFNRSKQVAYTSSKKTNKPFRRDTIPITSCTYDLMSIIYYARNLDYSIYRPGDTIPVTILLDNELTNIYYRYLGKQKIRVRGFGKFNCIKFSVYLVEGTIFEGGEDMEVWITDDPNRIPLKVNSPILVGSVKARIIKIDGIKYELSSRIK
jgi:hypothetical protein